ncbi:MAG TPA: hypothetical protein VJ767_06295 [Nitrososphaeraceae archaeon]|nr:hypothetical protein [Nitrososphaeraceae archaeon]
MTSISVSVEILGLMQKLKVRNKIYDHLLCRMLVEWQNLQEYRLDMDQVIRLNDKQIATLENELKEKRPTFNSISSFIYL